MRGGPVGLEPTTRGFRRAMHRGAAEGAQTCRHPARRWWPVVTVQGTMCPGTCPSAQPGIGVRPDPQGRRVSCWTAWGRRARRGSWTTTLPRRARRATPGCWRASAVRAGASAVLIIGLYAALPVRSTSDVTSVLVLIAGILLLGGLVALRVRQIQRDRSPELRAIETRAPVVPLFVALFAWSYLPLSAADPGAFTEPLNRIDAAYLSLVILVDGRLRGHQCHVRPVQAPRGRPDRRLPHDAGCCRPCDPRGRAKRGRRTPSGDARPCGERGLAGG